jgi:microcystin-dependent protein
LLEQSVAGVISIAMLDANYTLSNFNGVVDEARNQVLVMTGALTATRNVIAPLVEKTYIVKNSTTGSQSIQIIGSSGLGVTIPNGATASVYCDGTNFYSAQVNTVGNQTINGNLTVTGTTTLSGALTYGGVTLSNAVTGTGNMVLSASPTFTGSPIAPTASTGTNTTQIATTAFVQASTAALGLGTMATQNANNVAITGGTMSGMTTVAGGAHSGTTATFSSTVSGTTITASTQFTGPGTGLTGTAASLSIGGNAATATNSTNSTNATNLTGSGTISSTTTGTTQAPGTNNTTIATTAFVLANGAPTGGLIMWGTGTAPTGWLLCAGAAVSRSTYAALFSVIGTTFGVGDGSTTFNLPNYTNRTPYGTTLGATGGSADAILVSHTHTATVADPGHSHGLTNLALYSDTVSGGGITIQTRTNSANTTATATTGITVGNSTEGVSGTNANLPPYLGINFIIKT